MGSLAWNVHHSLRLRWDVHSLAKAASLVPSKPAIPDDSDAFYTLLI